MRRIVPFLALLVSAAALWAQGTPRVSGIHLQGDGQGISPGAIVDIFGGNFSPSPTVTVSGLNARVYSYSTNDIQFQIPPNAAPGSAPLVVTTQAGSSFPFPLTLTAV